MGNIKIIFKDYKCFGEEQLVYSGNKLNIFIGRNNSGKSSAIEILKYFTEEAEQFDKMLYHKGRTPKIFVKKPLTEDELRQIFKENTMGGAIGGNHWQYGKKYVGSSIKAEANLRKEQYSTSGKYEVAFNILGMEKPFEGLNNREREEYLKQLSKAIANPFKGKRFKRIRADRDVVPEVANAKLYLDENGNGATNYIQTYINKSDMNEKKVKQELLGKINELVKPDFCYEDIFVQTVKEENGTYVWEVFLEEKGIGKVALSQSGSGLKTILLVLILMILVPDYEKKELSEYIFCLEELENNMHPHIQRRLLNYIDDIAKNNECHFFITTHSPIAIDHFSNNSEASIFNVKNKMEYML